MMRLIFPNVLYAEFQKTVPKFIPQIFKQVKKDEVLKRKISKRLI
jgi:hypothetical protein